MLLKFIICKKKKKRKTIDGALSQKKKKEHQSQKYYSKSLTLSRYSSNQIPIPIFERTTNKKKYIFTEPRQMRISLMNNYAFNSRQMMRREGGLFEIVPIFGKMIIKPINLAAFGDISGSSTNNTGKLNNYGCDRRVCTFRGGAIHARFYECRD